MFFTGGIPQRMELTKQKIALDVTLDPEHAPEIQKEFEQVTASLQTKAKSLEELIIKENQLPSDRYKESDREQVIAVAVDDELQPSANLLRNRVK